MLADWLPEEDTGHSLWPKDSVAYTRLTIRDLPHRMHLITQQLIALATLNKVLTTLGLEPETSLVAAIAAAERNSCITGRQAKYLHMVNKEANNAKHIPILERVEDEIASSSTGAPPPGGSEGD